MKISYIFIGALVLFSFTTPQQNNFKSLQELTGGTWKMKTSKGFIGEKWMKKNDKELTGVSFTVIGDKTSVEERTSVTLQGNEIYYTAIVNGQNNGKPVLFKLTSVHQNTYTFTNPQHDYPQVVAYRFIKKDSVNAWIDVKQNGKKQRIDFNYKREK